ncbi:hormogonium polysaccharide biosynthesis glycosyltransferase HpsE [Anabaena sp. FACHB-709]|uniref:Glycosyltransferase family 2 protein n=2 Tax=Nostocaceae TaxID=1162 RepID=A0ABR7ZM59_ANACY|nr:MULTISPECIES: hormogonium polysaccharide biosynthesis glycosyltransferase HpsE [Nostocaceae]BAY67385.1 putative glycosyl transferase [Trichormus variabilis NIES-23]HBW30871.1 glycosyltransferase family 2 protein [Nostoc sp. UBA8866]MBD2173327.1 glycosyltransferase family 2 protein [Anabaena cylindrica FACHB-318]MBD2274389.1 glycosyltransferase family 2 protein [Nostoc sp. PCC 7120 = FACHB-418]MBD2285319.1 glycosyltransferase family 2 protein [Anabaena cylindrica FACHB-170]
MQQELQEIIETVDFTVAIPTWNGAERLPQVLDRLLAQTGTENLRWEVIVIDNNSSDRTPEVVSDYQKKFTQCQLKYFLETQQGLAYGRLRAIKESQGKFVAFLDDDNLAAPDWVLQSYNFGEEHPRAGAWSGQIHGDFEVTPPDNFSQIQAFLAIREHGQKAYIFDAENLKLPPGAALVIRKQAWRESVPQQLVFKGRIGKLMIGGEDTEVLLYIYKAGWEIWYNPKMEIYHKIPHGRLETSYLVNVARGCGLCIFQLRLINAKKGELSIILLRTILGNIRRLFHHIMKYKNNLKGDIVALVEFNFYLGSLLSPIYSLMFYFNNLTNEDISLNND